MGESTSDHLAVAFRMAYMYSSFLNSATTKPCFRSGYQSHECETYMACIYMCVP